MRWSVRGGGEKQVTPIMASVALDGSTCISRYKTNAFPLGMSFHQTASRRDATAQQQVDSGGGFKWSSQRLIIGGCGDEDGSSGGA
jgi:hypothetical protein